MEGKPLNYTFDQTSTPEVPWLTSKDLKGYAQQLTIKEPDIGEDYYKYVIGKFTVKDENLAEYETIMNTTVYRCQDENCKYCTYNWLHRETGGTCTECVVTHLLTEEYNCTVNIALLSSVHVGQTSMGVSGGADAASAKPDSIFFMVNSYQLLLSINMLNIYVPDVFVEFNTQFSFAAMNFNFLKGWFTIPGVEAPLINWAEGFELKSSVNWAIIDGTDQGAFIVN